MRHPAFRGIIAFTKKHRFITALIVVAVLIAAYLIYRSTNSASTTPQYTLSVARIGSITQTVSGTGQISASNQTDIQSQVSGTITSIIANVGQTVRAGQLIATIDSTNAAISLKNAQLSLAKLTQPPKATDLSNATNNVSKAYNDTFNAASTLYLDLPNIMSGMKDMLYGQNGFLSDQQATFLSSTARAYRDTSGVAYDKAVNQYQSSLNEFKALTRSSATSSLDKMFADTYATAKAVSEAVTDAQNAITFITASQPDYRASDASTSATNVNSWATKANSDLSGIVSAQNGIVTSNNSLQTLQNGSDALDIETARLSLEQSQRSYDNYFIRAPYDGVIGRIPVNVYGQAGASTIIATIIGNKKIATVSLNEVDAARVADGQPVNITFDAIDGLNATGTVTEVDQVGTVSQGVVSYGVKILVNTDDPRIKPGMSVNTSIVTGQRSGVVIVPSSAVKVLGSRNYVQTFANPMASSTNGFGTTTNRLGSTTNGFTRSGLGSSTNLSGTRGQGQALTISSATPPEQVTVTTGLSDDTNTEITSGLSPGQFVVTKTVTSSSQAASAPSLLSSLGARGGTGGASRTTGSAAARPGN